jgi:hypothetical protein
MSNSKQCECCERPIKGTPEIKTLRGKEHTFCSEFCFRLYFYSAPKVSYDDMKKMYTLRFIAMDVPDLHYLAGE